MIEAVSPAVIAAVVGFLGLLATMIGTSIRATWKLAALKEEIVLKIERDRIELREQLTQEHTDVMKQFGDSLGAMREKIIVIPRVANIRSPARRASSTRMSASVRRSPRGATIGGESCAYGSGCMPDCTSGKSSRSSQSVDGSVQCASAPVSLR